MCAWMSVWNSKAGVFVLLRTIIGLTTLSGLDNFVDLENMVDRRTIEDMILEAR